MGRINVDFSIYNAMPSFCSRRLNFTILDSNIGNKNIVILDTEIG